MLSRVETILAIVILVLVILLACAIQLRGDWPKQRKQDVIDALDNPVAYSMGFIEELSIADHEGKKITKVRILPYAANAIYDRRFSFCGNQAKELVNKGPLVVITYDRIMREGKCNDLISVHEVIVPARP